MMQIINQGGFSDPVYRNSTSKRAVLPVTQPHDRYISTQPLFSRKPSDPLRDIWFQYDQGLARKFLADMLAAAENPNVMAAIEDAYSRTITMTSQAGRTYTLIIKNEPSPNNLCSINGQEFNAYNDDLRKIYRLFSPSISNYFELDKIPALSTERRLKEGWKRANFAVDNRFISDGARVIDRREFPVSSGDPSITYQFFVIQHGSSTERYFTILKDDHLVFAMKMTK